MMSCSIKIATRKRLARRSASAPPCSRPAPPEFSPYMAVHQEVMQVAVDPPCGTTQALGEVHCRRPASHLSESRGIGDESVDFAVSGPQAVFLAHNWDVAAGRLHQQACGVLDRIFLAGADVHHRAIDAVSHRPRQKTGDSIGYEIKIPHRGQR